MSRKPPTTVIALCDVLICAAAAAALVLHCLTKSPRKLFWTDEVFTIMMVRDLSFVGMLDALKDTINASPPTYFVGLWLWCQTFGTSELALRMFSCIGMGCAWVLCWLLIRCFASRLTATAATAFAFFTSMEILYYNAEARCYAMYVAAYMAASLLLVVAWTNQTRAAIAIAAGTFLAHTTLVTTHYVGCFYSLGLVAASVTGWAATRWVPLRAYSLGGLLGMAMAATSVPFYLAQRSLGGKDNWIEAPGVTQLFSVYLFGLDTMYIFVLGCAVVTFAIVLIASHIGDIAGHFVVTNAGQGAAGALGIKGVSVVCLTSFLVPIALWLESKVGIRLFLARYFLPSFVIWPCIFAYLLQHVSAAAARNGSTTPGVLGAWVRRLPAVLSGALICFGLLTMLGKSLAMDSGLERVQHIVGATHDLDVVFASSNYHVAIPVQYYSGYAEGRGRYVGTERGGAFGPIERRFWPGFSVSLEELGASGRPFLMEQDEIKGLVGSRAMSGKWRVVKRVEGGLVLIENQM